MIGSKPGGWSTTASRFAAPAQVAIAEGDERRGLGCCPGVVRGTVRVVTDPRNVELDRGSVLVAEHTDPGWIMIFPSALGVLVERGSLLSHAAIVARELGIPAIVSVPGVTSWLADGDLVELDGSTGIVRKHRAQRTRPPVRSEAATRADFTRDPLRPGLGGRRRAARRADVRPGRRVRLDRLGRRQRARAAHA